MPTIKFVCTDRKLKQGEIRNRPGICFKKGLSAGFVAGLNKALKKQARIKPILTELTTARPILRQRAPAMQAPAQNIQLPSLEELIRNRPKRPDGKYVNNPRDLLMGLAIRNPNFTSATGNQYRTRAQKKAMDPAALKAYYISTGEYRK